MPTENRLQIAPLSCCIVVMNNTISWYNSQIRTIWILTAGLH